MVNARTVLKITWSSSEGDLAIINQVDIALWPITMDTLSKDLAWHSF